MEKYMIKIVSGIVVLIFGLIATPLVKSSLDNADFAVNSTPITNSSGHITGYEETDLNLFKVIIFLVYIVGIVVTSVILFVSGIKSK